MNRFPFLLVNFIGYIDSFYERFSFFFVSFLIRTLLLKFGGFSKFYRRIDSLYGF